MSILDGMMGNASEVDAKKIQEEFKAVLLPDEEVARAYQLFRDSFIFTNRRLILVDKKVMTGKRSPASHFPIRADHRCVPRVADVPRAQARANLRRALDPEPRGVTPRQRLAVDATGRCRVAPQT